MLIYVNIFFYPNSSRQISQVRHLCKIKFNTKMKHLIYPALIATLISSSAFTLVNKAESWNVKGETYSVKFTSKKFDGLFRGLKSVIHFDENKLTESSFSATIDAGSINTGNGMRNKHARQGLGAEQFPEIRFESSSIVKSGNQYEALGKLTIKGTTKDIRLPFTFSKTAEGGLFEGNFSVKPAEYKVEKSGTPDQIDIQLSVPVTK